MWLRCLYVSLRSDGAAVGDAVGDADDVEDVEDEDSDVLLEHSS